MNEGHGPPYLAEKEEAPRGKLHVLCLQQLAALLSVVLVEPAGRSPLVDIDTEREHALGLVEIFL